MALLSFPSSVSIVVGLAPLCCPFCLLAPPLLRMCVAQAHLSSLRTGPGASFQVSASRPPCVWFSCCLCPSYQPCGRPRLCPGPSLSSELFSWSVAVSLIPSLRPPHVHGCERGEMHQREVLRKAVLPDGDMCDPHAPRWHTRGPGRWLGPVSSVTATAARWS